MVLDGKFWQLVTVRLRFEAKEELGILPVYALTNLRTVTPEQGACPNPPIGG
jgi:hypothetical protein